MPPECVVSGKGWTILKDGEVSIKSCASVIAKGLFSVMDAEYAVFPEELVGTEGLTQSRCATDVECPACRTFLGKNSGSWVCQMCREYGMMVTRHTHALLRSHDV